MGSRIAFQRKLAAYFVHLNISLINAIFCDGYEREDY